MSELAMLGRHVLASFLLGSHRTLGTELIIAPDRNHNQHAPRELVEIHEALFHIYSLEARRVGYLSVNFPIELPDRDERYAAHLRASRKVVSMANTASRVRRPSTTMFGGHHRS